MASANETPRQKLISLMYLVFISMLALTVGKEVLEGFGQLYKKATILNEKIVVKNEQLYEKITINAEEKKGHWVKNDSIAKIVKNSSQDFYNYLDQIKTTITEKQKERDPNLEDYNSMEKGDELDVLFFGPNGIYSDFIEKMDGYKDLIKNINPDKSYMSSIDSRFFNGDENHEIINSDGVNEKWINSQYEGFPLISSLAKFTFMQNDIRNTENEILNNLLGHEFEVESQVNKENYITFLRTSKSAYFQGERFDGKVILGRKGGAQLPNKVSLKVNNKNLNSSEYKLIPGGIELNMRTGNSGDYNIKGELLFLNNGIESKIPVNQTFSVISKPNAALVSADKMNVVYRGVDNPLTISIPGIANNKITASAPGLRKIKGSKYILRPGKGRTIRINTSGILPDGSRISTPVTFRIKDIPGPIGTVRGQSGNITIPKSNLAISTIGAVLDGFDFDITLKTVSFKFKAPGRPTIEVKGNKLDSRAKNILQRVKAGSTVHIFDIKVTNPQNPSYKFKKVTPIICDIVN